MQVAPQQVYEATMETTKARLQTKPVFLALAGRQMTRSKPYNFNTWHKVKQNWMVNSLYAYCLSASFAIPKKVDIVLERPTIKVWSFAIFITGNYRGQRDAARMSSYIYPVKNQI